MSIVVLLSADRDDRASGDDEPEVTTGPIAIMFKRNPFISSCSVLGNWEN